MAKSANPRHGLHTCLFWASFMNASDIFSQNSVRYYTEQRRTPASLQLQACLDRCSSDLCDYGCFKGLDSDHMTKIERSRVKEMSAIQGQNEAVAQESSKKGRWLVFHWRGCPTNSHTAHFSQDITMWWIERLGGMLLIRKWHRGLHSWAQRSEAPS